MLKFYWYGELGTFCLEGLGRLNYCHYHHPQKTTILTSKEYYEILYPVFPKLKYEIKDQDPSLRRWRVNNGTNYGKFDVGDYQDLLTYSYSLTFSSFRKTETRQNSFISILPRARSKITNGNFAVGDLGCVVWATAIEILSKKYKIVTHGFREEIEPVNSLIHAHTLKESIYYLERSKFCLTPYSGFVMFSMMCECNPIILSLKTKYDKYHTDIGSYKEYFNSFVVYEELFNSFATKRKLPKCRIIRDLREVKYL
jgi:hypothetical protein